MTSFMTLLLIADNARRETGGTGLGLYYSQRLAQQMGGRAGVDSEGSGQGSTFWFEVPLRVLEVKASRTGSADAAGAAPLSQRLRDSQFSDCVGSDILSCTSDSTSSLVRVPDGPAQGPTTTALPQQITVKAVSIDAPIHVLVVDDVASIRMLMRRLILQYANNAVVSEAADGESACQTMLAAKTDGTLLFLRGIVCMDKEMPRCDGFAATRRMRGHGISRSYPRNYRQCDS